MNDQRSDSDPSTLTTQQLWREIATLKELIETRLDAMDEALKVASENYTRFPTEVDKATSQLRELIFAELKTISVRFDAVAQRFIERDVYLEQRFTERDTRFEQAERAAKEAIAAALQAAKEAVGEQAKNFTVAIDKAEAANDKRFNGLSENSQTAIAGLTQQHSDQKDRITRIESLGIGAVTQRAEARSETGVMWVVIGGVLGIAGLVVAGVALVVR